MSEDSFASWYAENTDADYDTVVEMFNYYSGIRERDKYYDGYLEGLRLVKGDKVYDC